MAANGKRSFAEEVCAISAALEHAGKITLSLQELHEAEIRSAVGEVSTKMEKLKQQLSVNQQGIPLPQQVMENDVHNEHSDRQGDWPGTLLVSDCSITQDDHASRTWLKAEQYFLDGGQILSIVPKQELRHAVAEDTAASREASEPKVMDRQTSCAKKWNKLKSKSAVTITGRVKDVWEDAKNKGSLTAFSSRCVVRVVHLDDKANKTIRSSATMMFAHQLQMASAEISSKAAAISHGMCHLTCGIMKPISPARFFWNAMCLFFILYDVIMVPMQAFKFENVWALEVFEWILTIWWTLDVYMTFRTGYIIGSRVEMRPRKIACHYARTWLLCDCIVVIVEWVNRFATAFASASFLRSSRASRMFKYLKLFRIGKIKSFWQAWQDQINSNITSLCILMATMGAVLLLTIHITTCIWFAIGESRSDGWTSTDEYSGDKDKFFWYFAAFRWVVAQFNGRTDMNEDRNMGERFFTCTVGIFLAVLAQAVFISFITKSMLDLSEILSDTAHRRRIVNDFMEARPLPPMLTSQVKRCLYEYQDVAKEMRNEDEVIAILPRQLQMDVLEEVRAPVLMQHPFFHAVLFESPYVLRLICCKVAQPVSASKDEVVFDKGDICERMLFTDKLTAFYGAPFDPEVSRVKAGIVEYNAQDFTATKTWFGSKFKHQESRALEELLECERTQPKQLPMGSWVSEPALWVEWRNQGRLVSNGHGVLLAVSTSNLSMTVKSFPDTLSLAYLHAQSVARELSNQAPEELSDILPFEVQLHSPLCVRITVISATGLRNTDCFVSGKSDPYCVCNVIGVTGQHRETRFKTKTMDNTLDPIWNHSSEVLLSWHQLIEFQLFDEDFGRRDAELGVARISPDEFGEHGFEGDLPLGHSSPGLGQGLLRIKIQVLDTHEPPMLR